MQVLDIVFFGACDVDSLHAGWVVNGKAASSYMIGFQRRLFLVYHCIFS